MARRHLTFTLNFSLDDDECHRHDLPLRASSPDTSYSETIDLLRTALHHQAALILAPFDPAFAPPEISTINSHRFDYTTSTIDDAF